MRVARRRPALLAMAVVVAVLMGLLTLERTDGDHAGSAAVAKSDPTTSGTGKNSPNGASSAKQSTVQGNGVTNGRGSEVIRQPEDSGRNGLPGLGGAKVSLNRPLITAASLPRTATRQGAIVVGFPIWIVPVADASTVRSSGVSSTSKTLQVSMWAVSSKSQAAVLAFYRAKFSAVGFGEIAVPSVGGSTAAAFERNADNLVVTTTKSRSGATIYSVFGTFRTGNS